MCVYMECTSLKKGRLGCTKHPVNVCVCVEGDAKGNNFWSFILEVLGLYSIVSQVLDYLVRCYESYTHLSSWSTVGEQHMVCGYHTRQCWRKKNLTFLASLNTFPHPSASILNYCNYTMIDEDGHIPPSKFLLCCL